MALVGVLGACMGLTVACFGIAFSSAPGWRNERAFYLLALACGLYSACDVVPTIDVAEGWRAPALRMSFAAASAGLACWYLLGLRSFPSRSLQLLTRVLLPLHGVAALLALVPGLAVSERVQLREVAWLGVVYRDKAPTALGEALVYFFALSLLALAVHILRAARQGVADARLYLAWLGAMLTALLVDGLSFLGYVNGPYIAPLAFLVVMLTMSVLTVRRFIASARALEELSTKLERRVEERTRELSAAHSALARAERLAAMGQLSAGVAHEVNNPAAAVSANLEYLRAGLAAGSLPRDATECLEESLAGMQRIARIVRQLLDTGRATSAADAEDAGTRGSTHVRSTVQRTLALVRAVVPDLAQLHFEVPEALHTRGSPQLLEQVLTNLVVNAGHAIAAGGRGRGRIDVRASHVAAQGDDDAQVQIEVQDDGCGMDARTQQRIFDPFFTTKPVGQGTGLGLSVTAGLVSALGGQLSVESTLGQGTVMRLRLPAAPPAPVSQTPAACGPVPAALPGLRLLLVEDDASVRGALQRTLGEWCTLELAAGVDEALARLREGPRPDAVLCDLMMPAGGGQRLYEELRARDPALAARLLFLTGGATSEEARRFLERQPQPVVLKPIAPDALWAAVLRLQLGERAGAAAA
ncbi:ATP-binding protein [Aggregicoccus sp. 17bor-14]|uniref:ATP-binding protein n=1 Tax=Myxococcaceae TaxID=31 RepID=UPI00351A6134